jgi:Ca-activated chloride channel family protein
MVLFLALSVSIPAFGQEGEANDDRTLSPYFFVQSDDPEVDHLPLQSTRADVDIAGVIARVRVTQVYKNTGTRPIEAMYVFPGSTRAAVFGMRMTIGERVIEASIEERQKARADYEQAKAQGKSASLLEQQRPNVFQMNVANIMPGDVIKVELDYTELLVPEDGTYEFAYPTVVGPRYSNTPREGASDRDTWVENPYLREGEPEPFTFDIEVTLNSGIPISRMACSSHETNIEYEGRSTAVVTLKDTTGAGTKDFILRYSLEGNKIQSGILLYPGEEENFFLVMMEPPARVNQSVIPPREYIFVLDVSGSMNGFPLNTAKKLMRDLITQLKVTDTFNVVLFAGRAAVLSETSLPATRANIEQAMNTIDKQRGGGGTELINALNTAFALPRLEENVARTTVIVTDGYVSCEPAAFDLIRQNLNKSNVFAFGIGSSVNRHLIEGMARCGQGEPLIVTGPDEAEAKAKRFREYIREPVLTQVEVDFDGFRAYDVEPLSIPDVLANRPVIVFGKYKSKPSGTIRITGHSGTGDYEVALDIQPEMAEASNTALRYLWARHRIKTLADYNNLRMDDERVKEVTTLGLTYNLLTDYTSFVAIDSLVRNQEGDSTSVVQPLPLPKGVSNLAVGGSARMAAAPKAMSYSRRAERLHVPLLSLGMKEAPASIGEDVKVSARQVVADKEGDSIARNQSMQSSLPGAAGSGSEVPTHVSTPEPKDGRSSSALYIPKGEFRSDETATGRNMRLVTEEAPERGPVAMALLVTGVPVLIIGLLIWRRRSRRKGGVNNERKDS